jgi:hypothetical protein
MFVSILLGIIVLASIGLTMCYVVVPNYPLAIAYLGAAVLYFGLLWNELK